MVSSPVARPAAVGSRAQAPKADPDDALSGGSVACAKMRGHEASACTVCECEATAATTCAGGGLGPQPCVVSSPVARSAAIGSDCHAPNAFLLVASLKLLTSGRKGCGISCNACIV